MRMLACLFACLLARPLARQFVSAWHSVICAERVERANRKKQGCSRGARDRFCCRDFLLIFQALVYFSNVRMPPMYVIFFSVFRVVQ